MSPVGLLVALGVVVAVTALAPGAGAVSTSLVINEVDYDQPSTDDAEFLELRNISGSAINLGPYAVELVNGNTGGAVVYQTIDLPDVTLAAGDHYVVCANAAITANCDHDVLPDSNLIQNGAPDAIGLRLGSTLVDALSYEGNSGAPYTEGSGVGLEDTAAAAEGLSRCPEGSDTDQGNVDFALRAISPGSANACPPPRAAVRGLRRFTGNADQRDPGPRGDEPGLRQRARDRGRGGRRLPGIRGLERLLRAGGGCGCGR